MRGAVALDFGATSIRYAAGWLEDGMIRYEIIERADNVTVQQGARTHWDWDLLSDFADRGMRHAATQFDSATLSVDTWGVDHGFVRQDGSLVEWPVAYRDDSHSRAFAFLAAERPRIYQLTGIQHQPFNTLVQLVARSHDMPEAKDARLRFLPDLLLDHVLDRPGTEVELTMASTSQLMGLDGRWSQEAFEIAGWPLPSVQPSLPGRLRGTVGPVDVLTVGSHDTASAVVGLGELGEDQAYLNVGTWGILGCLVADPLLADEAFTNERGVDGGVRYLTNIPGFFIVDKVFEQATTRLSKQEWLARGEGCPRTADLTAPEFFNPTDMRRTLAQAAGWQPDSEAEWAGLALQSLVATTAARLEQLERAVGRRFREVRLAGGGSGSVEFCQSLASATGRVVWAGPQEATLLGNLAGQLARGDWDLARALVTRSTILTKFQP